MADITMKLSTTDLLKEAQALIDGDKVLRNSLAALHVKMLDIFARSAGQKYLDRLNQDRRGESGLRAGDDPSKNRMTGRFYPFGARSGAGTFKGEPIFDRNLHRYGWGYPNIEHADAASHGIWRVLEYGLKGTKVEQDPDEHASRGTHMVPPTSYNDPVFTPYGPAYLRGKGIKGKRFLRDTWAEIEPTMEGRWRKVFEEWRRRQSRR